jgi:hypothetical protein
MKIGLFVMTLLLVLIPVYALSSQKEEGGLILKSRAKSNAPREIYYPNSIPSPNIPEVAQVESLVCDNGTPFAVGVNDSIGWMEAMQFTTTDSCSLYQLLYWPADPDTEFPNLHWMIWADSSGLPGALLDSGAVSPFYDSWYSVTLPDTEWIFLQSGTVFYIGWASVESPFYYNAFDDTLDTLCTQVCTYWFDGAQWQCDLFWGGDFLIRGLCQPPDTVGVEEKESDEYRTRKYEFRLLQNQPNPFNKLTAISYELRAPSHITLQVYDIMGRLVETLVEEKKESGIFEVEWDGRNPKTGIPFSSGIYFYRLESPNFVLTKKLTLLR